MVVIWFSDHIEGLIFLLFVGKAIKASFIESKHVYIVYKLIELEGSSNQLKEDLLQ